VFSGHVDHQLKQNQLTRMYALSGIYDAFPGIEDCQDLSRFEIKNLPTNQGTETKKKRLWNNACRA